MSARAFWLSHTLKSFVGKQNDLLLNLCIFYYIIVCTSYGKLLCMTYKTLSLRLYGEGTRV